ncbi:MAG: peptidase S41 [Alphaproteobacteria bacterium]|nr:peptidase S41 [Alphaproteobacteria bacterium]
MHSLKIVLALIRGSTVAFTALLLTACNQIGPTIEAEYSNEYGLEMFETGYRFISDRYILPVSLRHLSFSGLSSLHKIDPKIDVRPNGRDIEVLYQNLTVGRLTAPRNDAPKAWSKATVDAISIARNTSPSLAGVQAEILFKAVFDGVLYPLDKFSRYDDAETANEKRAYRDGFGGIGIKITKDEEDALIMSVIEGGPAAKAGVRPLDRITHIEGDSITDWTQRQLVDALRGPINSMVTFTVTRKAIPAPIGIEITRQHVVPETVEVRRDGNIAIMRLSGFNIHSARELQRAIKRQIHNPDSQPTGFVLDLRSNPGGRLDVSIDVADIFLGSGEITVTRGRHPGSRQAYKASRGDETGQRPIIILINGNSASASEIVTAALQDHGRAVVIGTNSFGKGSVQSVLRLPNSGEITLTWSRFLAPSGYRLHELGILPNICTHGGGLKSADALMPAVRDDQNIIAAQLSDWRATGNNDTADRAALRRICPSDDGLPDIDMALAKAVIGDMDLYASLLRRSDTTLAHR